MSDIDNVLYYQREAVAYIRDAGSKTELMNFLTMAGDDLPKVSLPEGYKISGCLSNSYFRVQVVDGKLKIEGSSDSCIIRGIMQLMRQCFDTYAPEAVKEVGVTWVNESGLLEHLTPQRQGAVRQMEERIKRACVCKPKE